VGSRSRTLSEGDARDRGPDDDDRGEATSSDDESTAILNHQVDGIVSYRSGNQKAPFRMFAKRPTQVARQDDHTIPLHVQFPPVPFLSWMKADSIVRLAANPVDERLWFETTSPYRDEHSATMMFERIDSHKNFNTTSVLLEGDLRKLLDSSFAIQTSMTIDRFEKLHNSKCSIVKIFSTIEERNDSLRRRVITWPQAMNEVEQQAMKNLNDQFMCHVQFHPALEVRDRGVRFAYSASLDFKKFYQQFELITKQFFAFVIEGFVYLLSSIPTGAVFPPLFTQALSRSILSLAIRKSCTTALNESDCCIDNLRLVSNNLHALNASWHELLSICDFIGATIGDVHPPPSTITSSYTYLGMLFSSVDEIPTVELAGKSKRKLISAAASISSSSPMLVVDVLAIFGQTVWGAIVTGTPLGKFFHVLKFIRRINSKNLNDEVVIWNSIVDSWKEILIDMTTMKFQRRSKADSTATVYTDASESGWGVVVLDYGTRPIRIFAGPWTKTEQRESINMLELRAMRIALRIVNDLKPSTEVIDVAFRIDNTSARSWASKARAKQFSANKLALEVNDELKQFNINAVSIDYVKSHQNIADAPSRIHQVNSASAVRHTAKKGDGAASCDAANPSPTS
jgi:hypothetical protein